MVSLENDRSVLGQTGDKLLQLISHDSISMDITGTTTSKTSFEMSSKSTIWVSPSAAKPNSTFPSPLTALGSLPTPWSSGLSYPCNKTVAASDQNLVESDSRVDDVTFRPNHPHQFASVGSGYLLSCDTRSTGQVVSTSDCSENIIATSNTTYDEVDVSRNSWRYPLAASRQLDEDSSRSKDLNYHAQPGCAQPGSSLTSFDGIDEVSSSTISLPSSTSTSTSVSVAIDALPIFMSPVESVKPCPQYCRCHGYSHGCYSPVSLQNNHDNTMLYPTPDLLQNTEPDQFSSSSTSTSWTMCMNAPLVCPGPFQPPLKSFKSAMPGSVDEGANSVRLVSSAPIASKMKSAPTPSPSGEDRAYPVEMVASAWLTTLVNEAVGKGIDHEVTAPSTASMVMNSASKMDSTLKTSSQTSFPPTTSQNCDKYDESFSRVVTNSASSIAVATNNFSTPDDHQSSLYPRIYPVYPPPAYPPPEYPSYPPPEYTGHFPFGYQPHPTPGYHAHSPCGYYPAPGSILCSRPTSHSLPYGYHGDATEDIPHIYRRCYPSREDDRPRSADGDKQKVPLRKRGPNTSSTRRLLVDQFPDLLPVIFWCLNHEQTSTSASRSSTTPMMTVPFIRKIIVECIPGMKERGGIGITTLRKFVSRVKKTMRNKVDFDRAKAIMTPTAMVASSLTQPLLQEISAGGAMDSVSHSVSKGNTAELPDRLADSIPSSIMKDSDFEFLKAPAEPILLSMMKFVNNTSKERSMASSRRNRAEKSQDSQRRPLDNDAVTSFVYDISTGGSMFQSLMDAHDIAEDEVRLSKTFCESSSADGSDANEPPVKSSDFQPEIAAAKDKGNDVANDPSSEPAMCNDYDSDDDIMVIDESFQNI
ncbi:uncharacterized protein LOC115922108 [Strongylocentrotus purpuratus]|uniref:Uncharacterized protein n=1 Tax=Strongylocentrotus purpuratus TaxID=7668 RepID=A0A7M7NIA2_STRPU|nr:uncharacterized protein LOC115922108 [Strongylocentrotus purpuratus]